MVDDTGPPDEPSLSTKLFSGTLWMFAMRWSIRLLGIFSVAILARLLDREDFGLIAMASAVIALPTVLLDVGVEQAVIREHNPSRGIYNTAWTIRAGQMALVAVLIFLFGPWVADFYNDPRIVDMVQVLSIMVFLNGLENTWTVSFRKNLHFRRDFAYEVARKLLAVILTIILAFALRSYWALVYGQVASAALRVVISFIVAPERPKPTLCEWRRIWSFSQWALVGGVATYIVEQSDRLILGRLTGAGDVGAYTVGREIAEMPLSEISMPANRALGPGFSSLQNEPERLVSALAKALGAVAIVAFPIAIGLVVTAEQAIQVLLGEGWETAIPVLQYIAFASIFAAITRVMGNTLSVIGHIRSWSIIVWMRAALLLGLGIPGAMWAGIDGMAMAFAATQLLGFILVVYVFRLHLPQMTIKLLGRTLYRPSIAVLIMYVLVTLVDRTGVLSVYALLMGKVAVGAVSYSLLVYIMWRMEGQPDGLEAMFVQRFKSLTNVG